MLGKAQGNRISETLACATQNKRFGYGRSGTRGRLSLALGFVVALLPQQILYGQSLDGQMVANRLTIPYAGVWIPGSAPGNAAGGHWWQPDNALGVCRLDPAPGGVNPPFQASTVANACSVVAKAGGQAIVVNAPASLITSQKLPANSKLLFVPDGSSKSDQIVRFVINPATELIVNSLTITVKPQSTVGGGGNGSRPVALALAPNQTDLYVGYIRSGDILKITGATTSNGPTVSRVAATSDAKGVKSMTFFKNDLYIAEAGGPALTVIPDPSGVTRPPCSANAVCTAKVPSPLPPGIPGSPAGLTTDGTSLYIGDAPLNGTPGLGVVQWNIGTGAVSTYSNNINPAYDGSVDGVHVTHYTQYVNPIGLAFHPNGDLYVSDDPSVSCAAPACPVAPTTQGHLWRVSPTPAAPTVTALNPSTGIPAGGTSVAISGTGFSTAAGATSVFFNGVPATGVSCSSTTLCTALSPSGSGTVSVTVTVGAQTSTITKNGDQFTYQAVTVTGISPNSGPTAGGTQVIVSGTGFGTDTSLVTVKFGNANATVSSCASTSCTVISPIGIGGVVDVVVTVNTKGGGNGTSNISPADVFNYIANTTPFISNLCVVTDARNPNGGCSGTSGITAGGTMVRLTGGNLTAGGAGFVNFGANPGTVVSCASSTSCIVLAPPSAVGAGTVGVTFSVGNQTSLPASFTYVSPSASVWAFGITAPKGGMLWVPGSLGGHWWSSDHANGFCRQDPMPAGTAAPFAMNYAVCDDGSIGSPGQAVYDSTAVTCQAGAAGPCHYIYVPDNAVKSTAVWRLTFDAATETIVGTPESMVPLADVRTLKPNGMALGPGPNGPALYVTDLTEANIRRIDGPAGDPRLQTLTIIGTTGDGRGANGTVGFIGNLLYISENRQASWMDVTQCTDNAVKPCQAGLDPANPTPSTAAGITGSVPLPGGVFVAGVTTDPVHNLVYAADSPGGSAATIWRYNPATPSVAPVVYLQSGTAPNPGPTFACAQTCTRPTDRFATSNTFSFVFGLAVDPANGNLMITEDVTAGNRSGRGRAWVSPFIP